MSPCQVKRYTPHTAAVNDLCFDTEAEYLASCSEDGAVVVSDAVRGWLVSTAQAS
jgi:WD40 repeat protein